LREAIEAADSNVAVDGCDAGSDTQRDAIHFSLGPEATITLASQLPNITDPSVLNINGQMAAITISGDDSVRVLQVTFGAKRTLQNLTVAHGNAETGFGAGGGVFNSGGALRVDHSTFSNNSAFFGGGIQNSNAGTITGTLKVINSTLSGNNRNGATSGSAGIDNNQGTLNVISSTFSNNGLRDEGGATSGTTLSNTILANFPSPGSNCLGTITDDGYNVSDDGTCNFTETTSRNDTDPKPASSLANNGGPTQTIALLMGSPAINAIPKGQNGYATATDRIATDQRGVKRPQGNKCDIGAFEKKQ
jgi:hypothetical protein